MSGKTFALDLSAYEIETPKGKSIYPLRGNLSSWLRTVGMFRTAEDVAEAVCLAKQIRDCSGDAIILDEKEATIIKQVTDKLIALTADGRAGLGGELHEEAICRVVNMKEVED